MKDSQSTQITVNIARFRKLTIGSAVIIVVLAFAMIFHITSALDDTAATKINLAGRQRLLAQSTLSCALAIDAAAQSSDWDSLEPALRELNQLLTDITERHNKLLSLIDEASEAEQIAYLEIEQSFHIMTKSGADLNKLTLSMIRRAPYLDSQTITRVTAAKEDIVEAHAQFLPKMEHIVELHELSNKSQITRSISHAKIGMIVLFLVLVGTILFVLEPAILIIRRQLRDLDKANRIANRAEAVRWRLLTNIGHEFRTPMNAITGFADLLDEDDLTESERSRLTKSILSSSAELTSLIESMLDLSAAESGQLRVSKEKCDLHQTLITLKTNMANKSVSNNLDIKLVVDQSCPRFITSDSKRLTQILTQVTDNAVKFTPKGSVEIHAKLIGPTSKQLLEVQVIDTGIGIDSSNLDSIFNTFQQAESSLTRGFGGAGLGLSVSRDIARALGGDITVTSTQNKGSTFTITIDPGHTEAFTKSASETQQRIDPNNDTSIDANAQLQNHKALIVDDAKDNRVLVKHILKKSGLELEFAVNGKQALEMIDLAIESNKPYDIILMDMQMPVMDGYCATKIIRKNNNNVPVVAVTAHALQGDRERCIESGCDEYLTKPIKKSLLIETCARLITEHKQKHQSQASDRANAA